MCFEACGLMKVKVAQLCLTLCNPRDCSLPWFSIHGISQARILEWVAISLSTGSSQPRDWYKGPIPTSLPSGPLASSCPRTWGLHPGTELYWKAVRLVYISCSVKSPFVFNHLDISIYIFQIQLCIFGVIFDSSLFLRGGVLSPSVQFSHSVVSDSLQPHELQHARPPCPSPIPGVHSNSCPSSRWCHPAISLPVIPFSSCPQTFPASGSFQMSQLFTSGGQSIGVSVSKSVLPMNTQDWSPLGWTGWISLESKGLSRVFSNATVQKHQFFSTQLSL